MKIARLFAPVVTLLLVFPLVSLAQKNPSARPHSLTPAEAERQGGALVAELLSQKPAEATTNTGTLTIRSPDGRQRKVPARFEVFPTATNWVSVYQTLPEGNPQAGSLLLVFHDDARPNRYTLTEPVSPGSSTPRTRELAPDQTMIPFAGSDFWVADLGLDFLHWPVQHLLRKELRLSQTCDVLESINPHPVPGGYGRVVSWIDIHNNGILHADAYGPDKELLKQFRPSGLQKVNGERQVKQLEISDRKNNSRSWLDFNPSPSSP